MRALLFVNPQSRRGKQRAGEVHRALEAQGIEIAAPHSAGNVDAVVVGGGDGTLARHMARALRLDVPVGLIPLGTFNELARTLDIPLDVEAACRTIAAGHTRRIDVATVNGAYYVNEASIGLSSRLTRLQRAADKQRFGFWAIAASAFAAFRYLRPFRAQVEYDGGSVALRTFQLTVANSHRFGGFITAQDAAIDDGRLDLYAIEGEGLSADLERVAGNSRASLGFGRGPASLSGAEFLGLDTASAPDYGRRRTRRPNPRRVRGPPRGPAGLRTRAKIVAARVDRIILLNYCTSVLVQ